RPLPERLLRSLVMALHAVGAALAFMALGAERTRSLATGRPCARFGAFRARLPLPSLAAFCRRGCLAFPARALFERLSATRRAGLEGARRPFGTRLALRTFRTPVRALLRPCV